MLSFLHKINKIDLLNVDLQELWWIQFRENEFLIKRISCRILRKRSAYLDYFFFPWKYRFPQKRNFLFIYLFQNSFKFFNKNKINFKYSLKFFQKIKIVIFIMHFLVIYFTINGTLQNLSYLWRNSYHGYIE